MLEGQHKITIPYWPGGVGPKQMMIATSSALAGFVMLELGEVTITVGLSDLYWLAKAMYDGEAIHNAAGGFNTDRDWKCTK